MSEGASEYYASQRGVWYGKGAERIQLPSEVRKEDLVAVCNNEVPKTRERLTARTNDVRHEPVIDKETGQPVIDPETGEVKMQSVEVNLKSIFFSIKHGIQYLKRQSPSYVVNVGSVSSFVGQAATPAYTASKSAVLGLSRSIALDYAAIGLRCNCVCPGITDTPMLREHLDKTSDPEATLAGRLRRVPMRLPLKPAEIARAILYLSCDDSAGVTGTSLVVDGGYLAAAEWDGGG